MIAPIPFRLSDGTIVELNPRRLEGLDAYLRSPKTQVPEMVRQINSARYYDAFFVGQKDLVFLDLGANIGLVSIFAAPACRKIVSVEPEPRTFRALQELTQPWWTKCILLNAAITPISQKVQLSIDNQDYSCHTVTNPKPGNRCIEAHGTSLADLLQSLGLQQGIDVCKVDIEGAEYECLTDNVLKQLPVKVWYVEVHKTPTLTREQAMAEMLKRMSRVGLQIKQPRANAVIGRWP